MRVSVDEEKVVNLKLSDRVKTEFKDTARVQRMTMQSVLESFVKSYIEGPEQYQVIMKKGDMDSAERLKRYAEGGEFKGMNSIPAQPMEFIYIDYKNFSIEKVMSGEEFNGECHIRINDDASKTSAAVSFFRAELHKYGAEVDMIDPILQLDYPIYVLISNELAVDSIDDIFKSIDDKIQEFKDGKSK
jgi:hypothetical protein